MSLIAACRSCGKPRLALVLDLGNQPLANALIEAERKIWVPLIRSLNISLD